MKKILLVSVCAFALQVHSKSNEKSFEILYYPEKKCVFAPEAKTKSEKQTTLIAAAKKFLKDGRETKGVFELCLAYIKPKAEGSYSGAAYINAYGYPGSGLETVDPGKVTWSRETNNVYFQVTINEGYERADSYLFVNAMLKHLRGNEACTIKDEIEGCLPHMNKVKQLIHKDLGVKNHPLDKLLH